MSQYLFLLYAIFILHFCWYDPADDNYFRLTYICFYRAMELAEFFLHESFDFHCRLEPRSYNTVQP